MSAEPARDRVGQEIGSLTVTAMHGRTKRQRRGGRQVIWRCWDADREVFVYRRTSELIRLDRARLARQAAAK